MTALESTTREVKSPNKSVLPRQIFKNKTMEQMCAAMDRSSAARRVECSADARTTNSGQSDYLYTARHSSGVWDSNTGAARRPKQCWEMRHRPRTFTVDTGATVTATSDQEVLAEQVESDRYVAGFRDKPVKMDKDGKIYMYVPDGHGGGTNIKLDATTMKGIRDDLLSASQVVKGLGYTLLLRPENDALVPPEILKILPQRGWEGFIKWNKIPRLRSFIPVTYDKRRRLWRMTYSFGTSPAAAKSASKQYTQVVDASRYNPSLAYECEEVDTQRASSANV